MFSMVVNQQTLSGVPTPNGGRTPSSRGVGSFGFTGPVISTSGTGGTTGAGNRDSGNRDSGHGQSRHVTSGVLFPNVLNSKTNDHTTGGCGVNDSGGRDSGGSGGFNGRSLGLVISPSTPTYTPTPMGAYTPTAHRKSSCDTMKSPYERTMLLTKTKAINTKDKKFAESQIRVCRKMSEHCRRAFEQKDNDRFVYDQRERNGRRDLYCDCFQILNSHSPIAYSHNSLSRILYLSWPINYNLSLSIFFLL